MILYALLVLVFLAMAVREHRRVDSLPPVVALWIMGAAFWLFVLFFSID